MHVFSGEETLEDILVLAYSLEQGLQDFYRLMADRAQDGGARELFELLAGIEDKHKDRIFAEYRDTVSSPPERSDFENRVVAKFMEGGMTTEEYFRHYRLDMSSRPDILDMAMTIEAQALDLYRRAADRFRDKKITPFFLRLSEEEKEHLRRLGRHMEEIAEDEA
jgi:rubrerythrin